jgi:hypothetical protein
MCTDISQQLQELMADLAPTIPFILSSMRCVCVLIVRTLFCYNIGDSLRLRNQSSSVLYSLFSHTNMFVYLCFLFPKMHTHVHIRIKISPQNTSKTFDSTYALAPNDGNYGGNFLGSFYNDRNPGLTAYAEVPIRYFRLFGVRSVSLLRFYEREREFTFD